MNFPGEAEAVRRAIKAGEEYGYGNVIDRVGMAWALSLLERYPDWSVATALRGAHFDEERAGRAEGKNREESMKWMREYTFADKAERRDGEAPDPGIVMDGPIGTEPEYQKRKNGGSHGR